MLILTLALALAVAFATAVAFAVFVLMLMFLLLFLLPAWADVASNSAADASKICLIIIALSPFRGLPRPIMERGIVISIESFQRVSRRRCWHSTETRQHR